MNPFIEELCKPSHKSIAHCIVGSHEQLVVRQSTLLRNFEKDIMPYLGRPVDQDGKTLKVRSFEGEYIPFEDGRSSLLYESDRIVNIGLQFCQPEQQSVTFEQFYFSYGYASSQNGFTYFGNKIFESFTDAGMDIVRICKCDEILGFTENEEPIWPGFGNRSMPSKYKPIFT